VAAVLAAGAGFLAARLDAGPNISPLRARIVALVEGQVGYTTDPSDTYCNKFSAYWYAGTDDCGNDNLDEEWCADFAAWAWKQAGAVVQYQLAPGYLNSQSASFYVWGLDHGTWHAVGSGYTPQPGDVAVYGLNTSALTAVHVAVVTAATGNPAAPDVVNGDGDRTGFSVVEYGQDQADADVSGHGAPLSGYVSPTAPAGSSS
jgi:CHAP domain